MDYSLPGSSVLGILQARILECIAMPSSTGVFLTQELNPHLYHLLLVVGQRAQPCWRTTPLFSSLLWVIVGVNYYHC